MKKNFVTLSVTVAAIFMLAGCESTGDYDYDYGYESQDSKLDRAGRDAMYDATESMSDQELEDLERNLRKSQE